MLLRSVALKCSLLLASMIAAHAHAADYYVSTGGDDANPGTESQPWQTIEKVNATTLQPGDRVLFRGGETFAGNLTLGPKHGGSAEKKTTITSFGTGRAAIDAGDGNGIVADRCNHLRIHNLVLLGSGRTNGSNGAGIELTNGADLEVDHIEVSEFRRGGIGLDGVQRTRITHVHAHDNGHSGIRSGNTKMSTNLYIAHCLTENNPGDPKNKSNHSGNGIVIGWAKDSVVEYCEARNNGWDMPREGNGPVGIWMWNAENVVIQFCISHDNRSPGDDGGGFDVDGGTRNSTLQYNLSYNNDGPGYFLCQFPGAAPLVDNVIRYNISQNDCRKNNRKTAIDIYAANTNARGCEIYNNTVYNEHGAAVGFGGYPIPGVVFRNNIFVTAKEPIVGDYSAARFEGNLWWMLGDTGFNVGKYRGFEQWSTATGQERIDGALVGRYANPELVDVGKAKSDGPTALDRLKSYRLLPTSPIRAAGSIIPNNGGRDFWGNKVAADRAPSLGAHEARMEAVGDSRIDVPGRLPR